MLIWSNLVCTVRCSLVLVYSQDEVKLSIQQSKDAILTELILVAVWTVLVFQFLINLRVHEDASCIQGKNKG